MIRFQSTLPVRGATALGIVQVNDGLISIHAPREGSDIWRDSGRRWTSYFNPRSP